MANPTYNLEDSLMTSQAPEASAIQASNLQASNMIEPSQLTMNTNPVIIEEENQDFIDVSDQIDRPPDVHQYGQEDYGGEDVPSSNQASEQMTHKQFKFSTKFNRPFMDGSGPRDAKNSHNYNQKLNTYI